MHDKLVSLNQDGCPFEICYVDEGTLTLHFYREIYIISQQYVCIVTDISKQVQICFIFFFLIFMYQLKYTFLDVGKGV